VAEIEREKRGFESSVASFMEGFLREKRACGCRYESESWALYNLDRFLVTEAHCGVELTREALEGWTSARSYERPANRKFRLCVARQFAKYLLRQGIKAYVPPPRGRSIPQDFVPRLFSPGEIRKLLIAVDQMGPDRNSPIRHLVYHEIFRLYYACGLRAGEPLRLVVGDVDLGQGVLTITGKHRKRLVPLCPALRDRLIAYSRYFGERKAREHFFPAPHGGAYNRNSIYCAFRKLLRAAGIPHGGRGQGPRVHDLRHTFAVHCLVRWYRQGADLDAQLPILATYMGHRSGSGTQRYLRLTADLFPDVAARLDASFGRLIPEGSHR
jgi:integrase/recombinase XerD